ncbi:hypothetical protein [Borrelia persica]|uniref:hypothetical protein n=1 Tax=Borrelia persica TaxID=44448 RepID=UPI000464AD1C|nr:hypothetical protein [Borrelia persica]
MTKVYFVMCVLNILLICCRQSIGNLITSNSSVVVETDFGGGGKELHEKKLQTPEELAYAALIKSFNNFKALYNYMPKEFDDPLFGDINKEFQVIYNNMDHKNPIYALFKGDVATLSNLKEIIMKFNTIVEYDTSIVGDKLIDRLGLLVFNVVFTIIDKDNGVFKNANLLKLKSSKDVEGLNKLTNMLDNLCVKWNALVVVVSDIINEAAKLDNRNDVIKKIRQFYDLNLNDPCQKCGDGDKLCILKNEFLNLYLRIVNQAKQLVHNVDSIA